MSTSDAATWILCPARVVMKVSAPLPARPHLTATKNRHQAQQLQPKRASRQPLFGTVYVIVIIVINLISHHHHDDTESQI